MKIHSCTQYPGVRGFFNATPPIFNGRRLGHRALSLLVVHKSGISVLARTYAVSDLPRPSLLERRGAELLRVQGRTAEELMQTHKRCLFIVSGVNIDRKMSAVRD